ncbi:MAG TPA: alanine racemase [Gemmatimonadaceae bacterium]
MHSSLMRRAWVEIDLGALLRNATAVAKHAGVPLLPMVKADAYGLGAVRVARALERLDPWGFGVATIAEGEELRRASIARPIVVFTPLLTGDFDGAVRANLIPTLGDAVSIETWGATRLPWHLAIDTGMSRAGVHWTAVAALRDLLSEYPPAAAFTHFHSAELNDGSVDVQTRRFEEALSAMPQQPAMLYAENSAAISREDSAGSPWSVVRPGIFLYGVGSGVGARLQPENVVSVRARVVDVRMIDAGETVSYDATFHAPVDRRIATTAIGYADGYRRSLSNRGVGLLHGTRVPITGLVTMDMTMFDVTDVPCEIGDIVTLVGRDGADALSVSDVAQMAQLSPYEILTGLRGRLPRRYIVEGQVNGDAP